MRHERRRAPVLLLRAHIGVNGSEGTLSLPPCFDTPQRLADLTALTAGTNLCGTEALALPSLS